MKNREITFAGAALLVVGLFVPIVQFPIVGAVNLFSNGSNYLAIAVLLLAVMAALLAAQGKQHDLLWPAMGAAALVLYAFGRLEYVITNLRESAKTDLAGNPFAGIAQAAIGTIQLQWGWLVLAAGAGVLLYSAVKARQTDGVPLFNFPAEGIGKAVLLISGLLLLAVPAYDLLGHQTARPAGDSREAATADSVEAPTTTAQGPSADEAAYIRNSLRLYDLEAKYQDSLLDGRVPGVNFKIKNSGNRTLNEVDVRVVFYDAEGKPIAEEQFTPVIVSQYSGGDNGPLRPNYIYQNEPDKFWVAKSVPSEWKEGKATASITDIQFSPGAR